MRHPSASPAGIFVIVESAIEAALTGRRARPSARAWSEDRRRGPICPEIPRRGGGSTDSPGTRAVVEHGSTFARRRGRMASRWVNQPQGRHACTVVVVVVQRGSPIPIRHGRSQGRSPSRALPGAGHGGFTWAPTIFFFFSSAVHVAASARRPPLAAETTHSPSAQAACVLNALGSRHPSYLLLSSRLLLSSSETRRPAGIGVFFGIG